MAAFLAFSAQAALFAVAIAVFMAFYRIARGPSLPDRVMGLDMIGLMSVSVVALVAIATDQEVLLDAALALALVSFLGTVAFSRFIERRGRRKE